jgi:hypothetical protein
MRAGTTEESSDEQRDASGRNQSKPVLASGILSSHGNAGSSCLAWRARSRLTNQKATGITRPPPARGSSCRDSRSLPSAPRDWPRDRSQLVVLNIQHCRNSELCCASPCRCHLMPDLIGRSAGYPRRPSMRNPDQLTPLVFHVQTKPLGHRRSDGNRTLESWQHPATAATAAAASPSRPTQQGGPARQPELRPARS